MRFMVSKQRKGRKKEVEQILNTYVLIFAQQFLKGIMPLFQ